MDLVLYLVEEYRLVDYKPDNGLIFGKMFGTETVG
jgi:hypothetical protein